jgi:chromosome segregation ATPase
MEALALINQNIAKKNAENQNRTETITKNYNQLLEAKKSLQAEYENLKSERSALIDQVRTIESKSFVTNTLKEKAMLEIQVTRLEEALKKSKLSHTASLNKAQKNYSRESQKLEEQITSLADNLQNAQNKNEKILILKKELKVRDNSIRNLEQQYQNARSLSRKITKELEIKQSLLQEQKKKIDHIQNEYNIMANKLSNSHKQHKDLEQHLEKAQEKIHQKESEIRSLKSRLHTASSKLNLRLQELSRAKDSIERIMLRAQNTIIKTESYKIPASEKDFDLPSSPQKVQEAPQEPKSNSTHFSEIRKKSKTSANTAKLQGSIIEIDNKYDFLIIDLGKEDGVRMNMTIRIMQNNIVIGNASIVEIREEISAANVKLLGDYAVKPGDMVVLF